MATRTVTVKGTLLNADSGAAIFQAKIRHKPTRTGVQSDSKGNFSVVLSLPRRTHELELVMLKPKHWPLVYKCPVEVGANDKDCGEIGLKPVESSGKLGVLSTVAATMYTIYLSRTRLEQLLMVIMVFILIPPALLLAVARGVDVPGTEIDERISEFMQMNRWPITVHRDLTFKEIHPVYHPFVSYKIKGDHSVKEWVQILPESTVHIEKGSHFTMSPGAGFLVKGKLLAKGERGEEIEFRSGGPDQRWGNLTFWDRGSIGSELEYCTIVCGGGYRASGATSGGYIPDPTGPPAGGGVLLFNTRVALRKVKILKCTAKSGGGIYIRNLPAKSEPEEIPGSQFNDVNVTGCEADRALGYDPNPASGGGIFVQRTCPIFEGCIFEGNKSLGEASCGGGAYVGLDARAKFSDCHFIDNVANADGGGIYARNCRATDGYFDSGVYVENGKFVENKARGCGGGVSASNARVLLTGVEFISNKVDPYLYQGKIDLQACGGAVHIHLDKDFAAVEHAKKNLAATVVENCGFTQNTVERPRDTDTAKPDNYAGGALCIIADERIRLSLRHLRFRGNDAWRGQQVATSDTDFEGWDGQWIQEVDTYGAVRDEPAAHFTISKTPAPPPRPAADLASLPPPEVDATHGLPSGCYTDRPANTVVDSVVLRCVSAADSHPDSPYDLPLILEGFTGIPPGSASRSSTHYLIDRLGKIYRLVDEAKLAWHSGSSRMPTGEEDVSRFAIGIDLVMTSHDSPTPTQYDALARLLRDLKRRHVKLALERIVGHDTVCAFWNQAHPDQPAVLPPDPGPLFQWAGVLDRLRAGGF